MMSFVLSHIGALCSIGYILVNEFLAGNPKVQSNSIGQLLTNAAKAWLSPRAVMLKDESAGK